MVLINAAYQGHFASGPLISLHAMKNAVADRFTFSWVAQDRPSVGAMERHSTQEHAIERFAPNLDGISSLSGYLRHTPADLFYLNSFFDPQFSAFPLLWRRLSKPPLRPLLIAPRGELSPGALSLKPAKKAAFITVARSTGLLAQAWFHATSELEHDEIAAILPEARGRIHVAANIRILPPLPAPPPPSTKLRIVFLSRIDPKKNLEFAIHTLAEVRIPVLFDIFGDGSDKAYVERCKTLLTNLPPNVTARFCGLLPNPEVVATIANYDLFFLPTRGENFGHAIFDALVSGTPVLISDTTPWRNLEAASAGWDLPLVAGPTGFAAAIEHFAQAPLSNRMRLRTGARVIAEDHVNKAHAAERTAEMLHAVIASRMRV